MKNVNGKNIWIIGASNGIGKSLAENLDRQGANVALSARNKDDLNTVKNGLKGDDHIVLPMDVSNKMAFDQSLQTIKTQWKHIDSVIFLPAIYSIHDGNRKDLSFIHNAVDINFKSALIMVEKIFPIFQNQKFGQIAICGSIAGYRGLPNGQPYCATKAALNNYTESLKIDMEPHNIDVKLISPGFVKTRLTDKNDFDMPFIIDANKAADYIAKGLLSSKFEIHFPKRMTYIMKFLQILPYWAYFPLARKIASKS
jgi:short-subunit dehydrogenase